MKAVAGVVEAGAAYQAGRFNRKVSNFNAANIEAEGEADVGDIRDRARQMEGQQLVSLAGSGFDVGSGTAFDLLRQTEIESTYDILKRRRKAGIDALGQRMQGAAAYSSGKAQAVGIALKAVADQADDYAKAGGG